MAADSDLDARICRSPMNGYQWMIVAICLLLNAQDGFDISAVAYASTGMTEAWGLNGTELGTIISAGLVGIVVGSFVLAPLADRFGRKPTVLFGLGLTAVGMALGSVAQGPEWMMLYRFVTGLGVGAVTPCINVIASEYSNERWRALSIGIYTAGFGVGAMLGGFGASLLLESFGWHAIFVLGAVNSVVSMLVVLALLPESLDHLTVRRPVGALDKVNRILGRLGHAPLSELPARRGEAERPKLVEQVRAMFSPTLRVRTLLLWGMFFTSMFAFYFLSGWTPRLVVLAGGTQVHSAQVGMVLSIGGSIGALVFGALAVRTGVERLVLGYGVVGALMFLLLGSTVADVPAGYVVAFLAGMLANGAIVGLFTLAPALYPARVRSTGVGWANGIGRTGSIIAPLVIGALVDAEWSVMALYVFGGVFLVLLAALAYAYRRARLSAEAREISMNGSVRTGV